MCPRLLVLVSTFIIPWGCAIDFDAPFAQSTTEHRDGGWEASSGGSGGKTIVGGSGGAAEGGSGGTSAGGTGGSGAGGAGGTSGGGTGGSGAGGAGGSAAGGFGGSGGSGDEICNNGKDDNNDGLVDCLDPHCKSLGFSCLPTPPSPWSGPIQFNRGTLFTCDEPWPVPSVSGKIGLHFDGQNSCPTCGCAPSTNSQCGLDVTVYKQEGCMGEEGDSKFYLGGSCVNVGMQMFGPHSVRPISDMHVMGGSCDVQTQGEVKLPPAQWQEEAWTCQAQMGGGCQASEVCSPPAQGSRICVTRSGVYDQACPADYKDSSWVVYEGIKDTRSCASCSCSPATGNCSGGQMSVHDPSGTCTDAGEVLKTGQCTNLPIHPTMGTFTLKMIKPGGFNPTCTPSGGGLEGDVTATNPITVCCRNP